MWRCWSISLLVPWIFLSAAGAPIRAAPSRAVDVAITLDDLPWVGPLAAGDSVEQALRRVAAVLRVHQAPATGFVVCDRATGHEAALRDWAAWGLELGNHTAAHRDLNRTPVGAWIADVESCHQVLRGFGDAYRPFFRFPMLHQGRDRATRRLAAEALDALGLETAHVSVDTSDWILTRVHALALAKGDAGRRRQVGQDFLDHIVAAIEHADRVARRKLGRPVPLILLLHANTLVEDNLDALLVALRSSGVRFISLEEALADEVYHHPDDYFGPKGLSWLYRMRPATPEDVAWDDEQAAAIRSRHAVLQGAREEEAGSPCPVSTQTIYEPPPPDRLPAGLDALITRAGGSDRLRSLVIQHAGRRVAEAYFQGAGPDTPANLKSVTKTLVSVLVGAALQTGCIASVDDPIGRYLDLGDRPERAAITLRQLLTMSSGLAPVDYGAIQQSDDWVGRVLAQPLAGEEVRGYVYDTPALQVLSAVLRTACGEPLRDFADDRLLGPLGTSIRYWRVDASGLELGGNDAYLLPRDLIALGELYLRGGRVGDRQLVPAAFVRESIAVQILPPMESVNHRTLPVRGYGFLWWLLKIGEDEVFAALGHGGQILAVVPDRELVVVLTSRWPAASSTEHYRHLAGVLGEVVALFPRIDGGGA